MIHSPRFPLLAASLCAVLFALVPMACNSTSSDGGSGGTDTTACTGSACASDTNTLTGVDAGSNPLGTQNGIAIGIGSHVYKLGASNVHRYSPNGKRQLDVNNIKSSGDGFTDTLSFRGARVYNASLFLKPVAPGTQTCADGDSLVFVATGTGLWAGTYASTACSVQVDYMTVNGGMGGKILSASLKNANGKVIKLTNAQFRVYQHLGSTGTAPTLAVDTSFHITMTVDSGTFELKQGNYFRMDSSGPVGPGSSFGYANIPGDGTAAQDKISMFFASLSNLAGTHTCGETFSGGTTSLQVWLGTYQSEYTYYAGKYGGKTLGSCSVTIPSSNSNKGSYTATLVATDTLLLPYSQRRIVIHGEFRK